MPKVETTVLVDASLADTWDAYFDPSGWSEWVDAFAGVVSTDGYPLGGGKLTWRTGAAGRGEVSEAIVEHEPRTLHRVRFEDPTMSGELETRFAMEGAGTRVSQTMAYALAERGVFAFLGALFVRTQVRRSLERSLGGFRAYVADHAPR